MICDFENLKFKILHLLIHLLVPAVAARLWFRPHSLRAYAVMIATMAVDIDHLLADPVFDPNRCSLTTHPLHSAPAIAAYGLGLAVPRLRLAAVGLLIHMGVDGIDCLLMGWGW